MVKLDLSNQKLTEVPLIPEDVTELNLSHNRINELKEGVFPAGLQELYLSRNQIEELKEGVLPTGLQILWLSDNYIIELKKGVFPPGLQELNLSRNLIVELKEDVFPPGLQELNLSDNQIVELKEDVFLLSLKTLNLSNNYIVELKKGVFALGLQRLYLSYNKIVELNEDVFPSGLQELYLHYNQIVELKEGVFPLELQKLCLSNNQILELKKGVFPLRIQRLSLNNNHIIALPIHLMYLRKLTEFDYYENQIKKNSLQVQRWLDRFHQGMRQNNQMLFCQSLENIMKDKLTYSLDECKNALLISNLTEEVKKEIFNFCDIKIENSIYLITFEDLFHYVMNRILKHNEKDVILKILEEEIKDTICQCFTGRLKRLLNKDTICKCFTGRLTTLLNVLNGFYPDIQIQIGSNEQITNVILILKEKYEGDELKDKVRIELKERGYEEEVIEEWISFIE